MNQSESIPGTEETTFPVRVAARMTGLTPELLRAWERRYGAVEPLRTEGGTRRYTADHLQRLQLLRQAVDAGHRISDVARMDAETLLSIVTREDGRGAAWVEEVIVSLGQLDSERARSLFEDRAATVGMEAFAREEALPLLYEIGERWRAGEFSVAGEHLATSLIRSMLTGQLFSKKADASGPAIVFATPSGEDHDMGLLIAALTAAEAGASVTFLGANMPADDLVRCAISSHADVLALGLVTLPPEVAMPILETIRASLPRHIEIWLGGAGAQRCGPIDGVDQLSNLDQVVASVALLNVG